MTKPVNQWWMNETLSWLILESHWHRGSFTFLTIIVIVGLKLCSGRRGSHTDAWPGLKSRSEARTHWPCLVLHSRAGRMLTDSQRAKPDTVSWQHGHLTFNLSQFLTLNVLKWCILAKNEHLRYISQWEATPPTIVSVYMQVQGLNFFLQLLVRK